ncbi:MAG: thiamine pyrophosphate-dependent enzyme [Acidobacteriota bacterium]
MTSEILETSAPTAPERSGADYVLSRESVLRDYRICVRSREASLLGRKEVLTGKAKFGIFGDGKEVPQVALARAFQHGDFRSGYYRDQTMMMALGLLSVEEMFAQLYADTDLEREPASAGRQMNGHFATRSLDAAGRWRPLTEQFNSSADVSPTGSQMPRLLGLAYASNLYRELDGLQEGFEGFSRNGDEIAFGTIGNASCAEGMVWETINAAGVLGAPMLLSIWDDGYGISVPNDFQITKDNVSEMLSGFRRSRSADGGKDDRGFDLYTVPGWDYPQLCDTYLAAAEIVRLEHVPAIVHVTELTQPQGHSTSGSHERYKSAERLAWERENDCLVRMRVWLLDRGLAEDGELHALEQEERSGVKEAQQAAWQAYRQAIDDERKVVVGLFEDLAGTTAAADRIRETAARLTRKSAPFRRDLLAAAHDVLLAVRDEESPARRALIDWKTDQKPLHRERYSSNLYSETGRSALAVPVVAPEYAVDAPRKKGFEILNACFEAALERCPELVAFGEDLGYLGDVNQGFTGLQEIFGPLRVADTGIRECTILGQAIGMAMRGLRPLAEIQYLDYVLYALQIMSDDLATVRWRTHGGQMAPVIVRSRGHRLEGVWHSGSPMAGILNLVRGMYICVPRDMTRAAGMYNTLLQSDDPALVIEVLNGYRSKETLPSNLAEMTVPLGVPEVLREGTDVTLVTYGANCRIAQDAAEQLAEVGIEVEIIDVQTLLPFDRESRILESLKKTHRVLFLDEDVPGGASAFMMQQVLEEQGGWDWLDAGPRTLTAHPHRPAYGSDGDYFSKPNREDIFDAVYRLMHEGAPQKFPLFYE